MSSLKLLNVQFGSSATAANNFVLSVPSVPDGTIKLSRGTVGSTSSDLLSFSSGGVMSLTGSMVASGNVTGFSDARLKTDVVNITGALSKVTALNGVLFTRIDTGERGTGVIAQEVQSVLPEAVLEVDGTLTVAYGNLVGLLIEAIKELKAEVQELRSKA